MRVDDLSNQVKLPALRPTLPADRTRAPDSPLAGPLERPLDRPLARKVYSVSNESYGSARRTTLAVKGRFVNTIV